MNLPINYSLVEKQNVSSATSVDFYSSVALIKVTPTVDMEKKLSQQIHFITFTNQAPAEVFRTFLSQAMTPYLKSFLRQKRERFIYLKFKI